MGARLAVLRGVGNYRLDRIVREGVKLGRRVMVPVAAAALLSAGFEAGTAPASNRLAAAQRLAADDLRDALLPPGAVLVDADPGSQAFLVSACRPVVDEHKYYAVTSSLSQVRSFYERRRANTTTIYSEFGVGYSGRIPEQRFKPVENLIGYDFTPAGAGRVFLRVDARVAPEGASCPESGGLG